MSGPPNIYSIIFQQLAIDTLRVGPAHEMPSSTFTGDKHALTKQYTMPNFRAELTK